MTAGAMEGRVFHGFPGNQLYSDLHVEVHCHAESRTQREYNVCIVEEGFLQHFTVGRAVNLSFHTHNH